jgi:CheY-like chemotaxis protein
MSLKTIDLNNVDSTRGRFGPDGLDRRRRQRAKIALPVHIRGGIGAQDRFEDVGVTIDASRDGLLVSTKRSGYWPGQLLDISLASAGAPNLGGTSQLARVVRIVLMPNKLLYALAVEYQKFNTGNEFNKQVASNVSVAVRVLVVEPDSIVASNTRDLLLEEGYEVVNVSSGRDALDVLRLEIPDVLLAEVEGGEVGGQELCSIIKKTPKLKHIPVILLTHSAQAADYSACHQAGAVMCIAMPCQPGKLKQAVRMVAPQLLSASSNTRLATIVRNYCGE